MECTEQKKKVKEGPFAACQWMFGAFGMHVLSQCCLTCSDSMPLPGSTRLTPPAHEQAVCCHQTHVSWMSGAFGSVTTLLLSFSFSAICAFARFCEADSACLQDACLLRWEQKTFQGPKSSLLGKETSANNVKGILKK